METNGAATQNRLLWWAIASIFGPLVLALTGTVLNLTITNTQRISAIEAEYQDISRRIDEVNRKLDKLLDRRNQ